MTTHTEELEPAAALSQPQFIDLHCHGGAGFSFDDADAEGIRAALAVHRRHGTAATTLSLVSAPLNALTSRLRTLGELLPDLPGAIGVHLEGPFLAGSRKGAHDADSLAEPQDAAVEALLSAGDGVLRQITIAPELPNAMAAISRFVEAGVTVAVGHTDAGRGVAAEAFDRGASLLTHALNAMPGLGHRAPGPVGAALDRSHVTLEVIADGHHVDPTLIRMLFAAAPDRVALVTDAMAATGLADGRFRLGGLEVDVVDGRPVLAGTDTLAGSTLTMDRAVQGAIAAGVPAGLAHAAATTVPARVLGMPVPVGR